MIRYILYGKMHRIARPFAPNYFIINYRWMNDESYLELSCNKNFMLMNIVTARNAIGVITLFQ